MFKGKLHGLRVAGLLAGLAVRLHAGDFVAPAEGPVAFRRDKVPLDAGVMSRLSMGLSTLVEGLNVENALERRGVAQTLALAVALDPANARARSLVEDFAGGKVVKGSDAEARGMESERALIWNAIGWLDTVEAGSQGRALAACLKDVVVFSDAKDPRVEALRDAGEQGAWTGWIPPLTAYEAKEIPATKEILTVQPAPIVPLLAKAIVFTPIWKVDPDSELGSWLLSNTAIRMSAVKKELAEPNQNSFSLAIGSPSVVGASSGISTQVIRLLQKQHGQLPMGVQVALNGEGLDASILSKRSHSISAASAVLASAAATGRGLGNVTIIGEVDATGSFNLPDDFWAQIRSLGPGNDGRLVLPAAAADYLPSMLAVERQQFFMDYEVLLADDFNQLLDLTAKIPSAKLATASEQFQEIRKKGASQLLGQYLTNPFVRRRLAEISQQTPYHHSAKMLGVQGSGNRPPFVTRVVLAAELRRAIEPMDWIINNSVHELDPRQIKQFAATYETCRKQVDKTLRFSEKKDQELVIKVQEMVIGIRALDRAARSRGYPNEVVSAMETAQKILVRSYTAEIDELDRESVRREEVPSH
jgi:hypothetical protein